MTSRTHVKTCSWTGVYQGYSDPQHQPRWYEGECTLPYGHDLLDHEIHGLRLHPAEAALIPPQKTRPA